MKGTKPKPLIKILNYFSNLNFSSIDPEGQENITRPFKNGP